MKPNDLPTATPWTMARRAARMDPVQAIRS